jgi:hypothetical protein
LTAWRDCGVVVLAVMARVWAAKPQHLDLNCVWLPLACTRVC